MLACRKATGIALRKQRRRGKEREEKPTGNGNAGRGKAMKKRKKKTENGFECSIHTPYPFFLRCAHHNQDTVFYPDACMR
jgi:hypothetical protein